MCHETEQPGVVAARSPDRRLHLRTRRFRIIALAACTVIALTGSSRGAMAGPASQTPAQLVQRAQKVMSALGGLHSESTVHLVGPLSGRGVSDDIGAHVSLDCSDRQPSGSAVRGSVRGSVRPDHRAVQQINARFIMLPPSNNAKRVAIWERDVTGTNAWHALGASAVSPAYAAYFNALQEACPGGLVAMHVAQSTRLNPAKMVTLSGRRAWAVGGSLGNLTSGLVQVLLYIDPSTYRVDRVVLSTRQTVPNRHLVSHQTTATTYSAYGESPRITAPTPGARTS